MNSYHVKLEGGKTPDGKGARYDRKATKAQIN